MPAKIKTLLLLCLCPSIGLAVIPSQPNAAVNQAQTGIQQQMERDYLERQQLNLQQQRQALAMQQQRQQMLAEQEKQRQAKVNALHQACKMSNSNHLNFKQRTTCQQVNHYFTYKTPLNYGQLGLTKK